MQRAAILAILAYKGWLSPMLSKRLSCRFHPTCSDYAAQAIAKYGTLRGSSMAFKRLRRCRPDNLDSCIDLP